MRKPRRARKNPADHTGAILFVVTTAAIIGVAFGLKYMSDKDRKSVLGV
jgi:hypothetical protein